MKLNFYLILMAVILCCIGLCCAQTTWSFIGGRSGYYHGISNDNTSCQLIGYTATGTGSCYTLVYEIIRRGSGPYIMEIRNRGVAIDYIFSAESNNFLTVNGTLTRRFSMFGEIQFSLIMRYPNTEIKIHDFTKQLHTTCGRGCTENFCNNRGICIDRSYLSQVQSECICYANSRGKHCEITTTAPPTTTTPKPQEPKEVKGVVPETCSKSEQPIKSCTNAFCEKVGEQRMCPYANKTEDVTITCSGETTTIRNEVSCGCKHCPTSKVTISGTVYGGDNKEIVKYAFVYRNKTRLDIASRGGKYLVEMEVPKSGKITFKFEDKIVKKYSPLIKTFCVSDLDRSIISDIFLKSIPKKIKIDTTKESAVEFAGNDDLPKTSALVIPPNSIKRQDGSVVTGEVELGVNFVDPRVDSALDQSPMFFGGVGVNSTDQYLSKGMFMISADDDYYMDIAIEQYTDGESDASTMGGLKLLVYDENEQGWVPMVEIKKGGSQRKKRDIESVLAGDARIVANKLYNLDMLMRDYCYVRVGAYEEDGSTPLNGVIIHAIYKGSKNEWQSFTSRTTANDDGACIQVPCDNQQGVSSVQITAVKTGESLQANNLDSNSIYSVTDNTVIAAQTKEFSKIPNELLGRSGTCPSITALSFQKKKNENKIVGGKKKKVEEINYITFKENNVEEIYSKMENPRFWWPNDDFEACYIKVKITDQRNDKTNKKLSVTSHNYGGTADHVGLKNKFIGTRIVKKEMASNTDTVCLEYKCGGPIFAIGQTDETYVSVRAQLGETGYCHYKESSSLLVNLEKDHYPDNLQKANNYASATSYEMFTVEDNLSGKNVGIVAESSTESPTAAKKDALSKCQKEFEEELNTGVAIHFVCTGKNNK